MFRRKDTAGARPLPPGLRVCETCGEARGTTPTGGVSACFCSGLICNRCSGRNRRPITDYYDLATGRWWHVPYFALMAHRCELPPGAEPAGTGWTRLDPDPDVLADQEAMTRLALETMDLDTELDLVDGDRRVVKATLGRVS